MLLLLLDGLSNGSLLFRVKLVEVLELLLCHLRIGSGLLFVLVVFLASWSFDYTILLYLMIVIIIHIVS